MKTVRYTFTTWNENAMASGFGAAPAQRSALIRQPQSRGLGACNVIDLAAWRAANQPIPEEEEPDWSGEEYGDWLEPELCVPAPRVRKSRQAAFRAELTATLAVAAAALAVILWAVVF